MISFHFLLSSVNFEFAVSNLVFLGLLCRPDGLPLARRHILRVSRNADLSYLKNAGPPVRAQDKSDDLTLS
jgi:hypothetical protein